MRRLLYVSTAALAAFCLNAQTAAPVPATIPVLSADDISVAYLASIDSVSRYLEKATAPNPIRLEDLQNAHVAPLRLTMSEFRKLEGVGRAAKAQLDALNATAQAARPQTAAQAAGVTAQLQAQKLQLVQGAMNSVKTALSPATWTVVDNFLKTEFMKPAKGGTPVVRPPSPTPEIPAPFPGVPVPAPKAPGAP